MSNLLLFDILGQFCANLRQIIVIEWFLKPFYYIPRLLSWFHEIFQKFCRKYRDTKNCEFPHCETETIQIEKWRDKNSVKISWKFCQMYFGHYNQKNKFCAKNSRVTMQKLRRLQIWICWSLTVLEKVVEIFWFLMIFVIKSFLSC